ncbi:putative hydroxymethylpyrimidine transport system substrate-binding protein [Bauldia litoralis]|uniref:Putative hydroxymethylpyrimidine transport system substrate-binding protein n=2 Tax=Bauldia litoralis TaxID=665467 RepID=A0A1G6A2V6_9HYPH|nr:putative hydroxymethylpyrimidine transport system substrate-binding protein [Bauldia litoralis]
MMGMKMLRKCSAALVAMALFASPAVAQDKVTVLLDWFVNPDHAPLIIAQEEGYFERHGLDVELIAPADPSAPPRLVAAGQADIAITYQPDLMLHLNEGLPLVRFGTLIETPLNALIVLKDGPVKSLADLKGKKVGYSIASIQTAYLAELLKSVGLTADDVELVNVNFNLVSALLSGQVDAAMDGYRNFELTQLDIEGKPGVAFFPEEHGVPIYDELIFVAKSDRRDDPMLGRFIAAIEEATIFLTNHPEEARDIFMASNADLNDELNLRAFDLTLPRFAKRPAAFDAGRYERFAEFLMSHGLIDEVLPVDGYAVAPR